MSNSNRRALVIYGKSTEELVLAVKDLPNGRSVQPGAGESPIKLQYGDDSIHIAILENGDLFTVNVLPQDLTPDVVVPLSQDKLQLLAADLDAVGISYSWDVSENDLKSLG